MNLTVTPIKPTDILIVKVNAPATAEQKAAIKSNIVADTGHDPDRVIVIDNSTTIHTINTDLQGVKV